jgi:3-phenylpropionate/trans-cinnamate dioxygenase ferredoxin reductase component
MGGNSVQGDRSDAPVVIVGGGQAGAQAATVLRQEGYAGEIVLFGDEPELPYQRPPLSKQYLAGEHGRDQILLRAEPFYHEKGVTLRIGERIDAIDCQESAVIDAHGRALPYSALLLATGGRARRLDLPGAHLDGIHYLRSLADADALRADMQPGRRLLIVGAGYIGLEVASVAVKAGVDVTIVEVEDRILKRVTSPLMSAFYQSLHERHGVRIRTRTAVERFEGDGRVTHALFDGERHPVDVVLIGIGIVPNDELAGNAGIECSDGIVVDAHCLTSQPRVYAAGDCTRHMNALLQRRLRVESVPNAIEQAKVAAAGIAGKSRTYAAMPWFWSDQYGLKLQMAGFSTDADRWVVRGDPDSGRFAVFYLADGALVAVEAVDSPRDFMAGRLFYGRRLDPSRLADPSIDIKTLVESATTH